jgi:hypothetical protein
MTMDTSSASLSHDDLVLDLLRNGLRSAHIPAAVWLKLIRERWLLQAKFRNYVPRLLDHRKAVQAVCDITGTPAFMSDAPPRKTVYQPKTLAPCLDGKTPLLPLAPLYPWTPYKSISVIPEDVWCDDRLVDTYLLFGLQWTKLVRTVSRTPGNGAWRYSVDSFVFTEIIHDEELIELVAASREPSDRWRMIYESQYGLLEKAIADRQGLIEQMKECALKSQKLTR